jgi:carbamoyl-phosphate synthase large subunit
MKTKDNLNVIFTCIGRRVSLLRSFREAAAQLDIESQFFGTDISELSSALQLCDKKFIVRRTNQWGYVEELLDIVRQHNIRLLVPTVDLDLKVLSEGLEEFSKLGCTVLISKPDVVDICQDKRKTFEFLSSSGFDTPQTWTLEQALQKPDIPMPVLLKPWDGYASRGHAVVKKFDDLAAFGADIPNCIVQEFIEGQEYTCDAFVDFDLKVRCVIPRKRIETRGGEVSKAQIVKDEKIIETVTLLVTSLKAGPGVITIQLFVNGQGRIRIIEINPRFGGGAPLSIKAGANFPLWILKQMLCACDDIEYDRYQENLVMLRYDAEVWLTSANDWADGQWQLP